MRIATNRYPDAGELHLRNLDAEILRAWAEQDIQTGAEQYAQQMDDAREQEDRYRDSLPRA